jgi:hypothetical protein
VKYFENEMMKIENDYSDGSSEQVNSLEGEGFREQEELENIKLRRKLEVFKEHLPEIHPFVPEVKEEKHSQTHRIDIASIIKKKSEKT